MWYTELMTLEEVVALHAENDALRAQVVALQE